MKTTYDPNKYRDHYENFKKFSPEVIGHFRNNSKVCIIPSDKTTRYSRSSSAVQLFEGYINDLAKRIDKLEPHYVLMADSDDATAKPMIMMADTGNDTLRSSTRNDEISYIYMGRFMTGLLRYDMPFSLLHHIFGTTLIILDDLDTLHHKKAHNEVIVNETNRTIRFLQKNFDLDRSNEKPIKTTESLLEFSLTDGKLRQLNLLSERIRAGADYNIGYSNADHILFENIRLISFEEKINDIQSMASSVKYFNEVLINHIRNADYYQLAARRWGNTLKVDNGDGTIVELKVLSKEPDLIKSALSGLRSIVDNYYWPFRGLTTAMIESLTYYSSVNFFFGSGHN